jgi:ribosomal protein S16
MSVRIVCKRIGGRGIVKVVACTSTNDKIHEHLATYDIHKKIIYKFNKDRYEFLLRNGAQPSQRVRSILR